MNKGMIFFFIFGVVAVVLAVLSYVFKNLSFSSMIGVISTIISIVLSAIAILYTFFSGKNTLELLNKIKEQNKQLVEKIEHELLKDAYDDKGLEAARGEDWLQESKS